MEFILSVGAVVIVAALGVGFVAAFAGIATATWVDIIRDIRKGRS